jgi:hypothetical protein
MNCHKGRQKTGYAATERYTGGAMLRLKPSRLYAMRGLLFAPHRAAFMVSCNVSVTIDIWKIWLSQNFSFEKAPCFPHNTNS